MSYQDIIEKLRAAIAASEFDRARPMDFFTQSVGSTNTSNLPAYLISGYAWALAAIGEWDASEIVARSIQDEDERGQGLARLSQRLADNGLLQRAELVARSITINPDCSGALVETVTAFIEIASRLIRLGQLDAAARILQEAESAITQRQHADHLQAHLLNKIAEAWVILNHQERALGLWNKAVRISQEAIAAYRAGGVTDVESSEVLINILRNMAAIGEFERSIEIAKSIENLYWQQRAINAVTDVKKE